MVERSQEKEIRQNFAPSHELAWVIGILAGGGTVTKNRMSFWSTSQVLLEAYQNTIERISGVNCTIQTDHTRNDGQETKTATCYSSEVAAALGDLRNIYWPNTILEQHQWILRNRKYTCGLLEGLFEVRGRIDIRPEHLGIYFRSKRLHINYFLADLLTRIGISSTLINDKQAQEGIQGIAILRIGDMQLFAHNIHLSTPEKEEKLRFIRERDIQQNGRCAPRPRIVSQDEVINEWIRLRQMLDHIPSYEEIRQARKQRITKFSAEVYMNRFGDGTFRSARNTLLRIIEETRSSQ